MRNAGSASRVEPGLASAIGQVNVTTRIVTDFDSIDPTEWERLDHGDNPFVSHVFLAALEASGTIAARSGWTPQHLAVYEGDELVAFAPTYIKTNSHGEFVFDWAWADAYHRHGLAYYPKLLTAVPYSPVTGPRLLTRRGHPHPAELRKRLVRLAIALCEELGFSSWHCNFIGAADGPALRRPIRGLQLPPPSPAGTRLAGYRR